MRRTECLGNAVAYEYHEDEGATVRYPKRIRYGVDNEAELQGWNLYGYVGNRPLSRVDPDGRAFAGPGCNLAGVGCQPLGGGFAATAPLAGSAVSWLSWRPVLSIGRSFGRWSISAGVVLGMGDDGGWGWGRGGWHVHIDWMPVLHSASRSARVDSGVERHPADEPMEAPRRIAVAWVGGALDRRSPNTPASGTTTTPSTGGGSTSPTPFPPSEVVGTTRQKRSRTSTHWSTWTMRKFAWCIVRHEAISLGDANEG